MDTTTKYSLKCFKPGSLWLLGFFFLLACEANKAVDDPVEEGRLSFAIPHFPEMPVPKDRPVTAKRVALGKKLFFDPILSRDRNISCGSCHFPRLAFSDGLPTSIGSEGRRTLRNSPTLFNVAWQPYMFMDGGNPSLESQAIGPIEEHNEMDLPFTEAMARVAADSAYQDLFQEAFGDDVNPFTLTTALGTFQRALVSYRSAFDRFHYEGDMGALSASAQRGLRLFTSQKLQCESCHRFPLTTDFSFQNNGLKADYANDLGRGRITLDSLDNGKFKVPTLRNIALTAPYMHDGSLTTLEAVIEHYARGGSQHANQSPRVTGFTISAQEKADLLAFLQSLTDTSSYRLYVP